MKALVIESCAACPHCRYWRHERVGQQLQGKWKCGLTGTVFHVLPLRILADCPLEDATEPGRIG